MIKPPSKKKKFNLTLSFKAKYLIPFFVICISFVVILAAIIRNTQQQLMKISKNNTQQIQTISVALQQLQQQQHEYQKWWNHQRSNKIQNTLYDALYKIKLANLYFSVGDNHSALQLLNSTQSILEQLSNKQVDSLKQQITTIIEYLKKVSQVNTHQTIVTLDHTIRSIESLAVLNGYHVHNTLHEKMQSTPVNQTSSLPKSHWWNAVLNQLKQLVIIHRTQADEGIFFKENALLIKQMIIQKLLQMQQALLRNDFTLYQHNTNIVITWLTEYCSKNKTQFNMITTTLTHLKAYHIKLENHSIDFLALIDFTKNTIDQLDTHTTVKKEKSTVLIPKDTATKKPLPSTNHLVSSKVAIKI